MLAAHATLPADLIQTLGALGVDPSLPHEPLLGGRTNQLFRAGNLVVKLYDPTNASPLFRNDPVAEALSLRLLGPMALAPALVANGPDWLIYCHVPGAIWRDDVALAARTLAHLHSLHLTPDQLPHHPTGSAALRRHALGFADASQLPPLPPDPGVPPLSSPVMIHGDAVAGNMIAHHAQLTLIDWQCPAIADPAEDIAAFLSPAMQWLYRGRPLTPAEITAFLATYPDRATIARYHTLAPLLHWRLAAHCQWRMRRGDDGYANALKLECAGLTT